MKLKFLLILMLTLASAPAQEKPAADPYRDSKVASATPGSQPVTDITIVYEMFSLPLALAAKLQREQLSDPEFYSRLVSAGEKDLVRLEILSMVHGRSGQKATTESISEQIYATEYQPPNLPSTVGVSISPALAKDSLSPGIPDADKLRNAPDLSSAGLRSPSNPSGFETRNAGFTLEVEPTLSPDGTRVDLRIVPENVTLAGRASWGQEIATAEMPVFESQRINTALSMRINRPCLVGTMSRPVHSQVDPESANRVWLGFATATLPKP